MRGGRFSFVWRFSAALHISLYTAGFQMLHPLVQKLIRCSSGQCNIERSHFATWVHFAFAAAEGVGRSKGIAAIGARREADRETPTARGHRLPPTPKQCRSIEDRSEQASSDFSAGSGILYTFTGFPCKRRLNTCSRERKCRATVGKEAMTGRRVRRSGRLFRLQPTRPRRVRIVFCSQQRCHHSQPKPASG